MFLILLGASFVEPRLRAASTIRSCPGALLGANSAVAACLPMGAMILAEVGVFSAATMTMGRSAAPRSKRIPPP